jgi:serine phosphatase RsbU (regulator of sigma subunit)
MSSPATAVVAQLEAAPAADGPGAVRFRWSNAGHLPPMLVAPDGTVTTLTGGPADLLLGVARDTRRTEYVRVLEPGATLLLYTDGLIERREESLADGFERLRHQLHDLVEQGLAPDELCDRLLERMVPDRPLDDIAVLAVRLCPAGE